MGVLEDAVPCEAGGFIGLPQKGTSLSPPCVGLYRGLALALGVEDSDPSLVGERGTSNLATPAGGLCCRRDYVLGGWRRGCERAAWGRSEISLLTPGAGPRQGRCWGLSSTFRVGLRWWQWRRGLRARGLARRAGGAEAWPELQQEPHRGPPGAGAARSRSWRAGPAGA